MSFLISVSISKTEKSMSKIALNMLSSPNESCPDFPILSSGELYLSFILCQEKLSFEGNFRSYAGIFLLFVFFLFPCGNLSQHVRVQFIHAEMAALAASPAALGVVTERCWWDGY